MRRPSNRQPRAGGGGGRGGRGGGRGRGGRGGGGRHHASAAGSSGVRSGMSVRHRDMLLDVLRNAATGGEAAVDESALAIGKSSTGNTVTFTRNRARTLPEHVTTALEVIGFPQSAAKSLAQDFAAGSSSSDSSSPTSPSSPLSLAAVFSLPQNVASHLDLIQHQPFVTSAEWELFELCVVAARKMGGGGGPGSEEQPLTEATTRAERHESRCSEWEVLVATHADHFLDETLGSMQEIPFLFDPAEQAAQADEEGGDDEQEEEPRDDDDDGDDDDGGDDSEEDQVSFSLRFRTAGGDSIILTMTCSDDYPSRPPLVAISAAPNCPSNTSNAAASKRLAAGVPPQVRFAILEAMAAILASFPCGMPGTMQALVAAAQEVIEATPTWREPTAEEIKAKQKKEEEEERRRKQHQQQNAPPKDQREQFLDQLIEATSALSKSKQSQPAAGAADKASSSSKAQQQQQQQQQRNANEKNAQAGSPVAAAVSSSSSESNPLAAAMTSAPHLLAPPTKLRQVEARRSAESFSRNTFLINDEAQNKSMLEKWKRIKDGGKLAATRRMLPAYKTRQQLLDALKKANVVIVSGATGSGKTTQCPQYVLESFIEGGRGSGCNIVCTQPRRIAASSVAMRVAEEREEDLGDLVGYSVRLESMQSKRTRLLFCTTGILLRRLQSDPNISNVSHVIVDEIHERGVDTDFLLILLRDLLQTRRPGGDLKIILMSATMDAGKFSDYFGGAPVIEIPGRTHPVTVVPLEVTLMLTGYRLDEGSPFAVRAAGGGQGKSRGPNRGPGGGGARYFDNSSLQAIADGVDENAVVAGEERGVGAAAFEVREACESLCAAQSRSGDSSSPSSPAGSNNNNGGGRGGRGGRSNKSEAAAAAAASAAGKQQAEQQQQQQQVGLPVPGIRPTYETSLYDGAARTMLMMDPDKINYELVEEIILWIDKNFPVTSAPDDVGAVLVFLPGMAEITQCMDQLQSNPKIASRSIIINLHSTLGSAAQRAAFERPPRGKRKLILGTNLMETSITIDDGVYVIDTGKFKENRYDARRALSQLVTCWVSKAAARQRQGRAGRVRPGMCFRLYGNRRFTESFADHQLCEMLRVPLESVILQIHALGLGSEVELLSKALDPPQQKAIEASLKVLSQLGALVEKEQDSSTAAAAAAAGENTISTKVKSTHALTSLGFHLTNIPVDVRIGKMIVLGAALRCVDPVLTIAACLSGRNPFSGSPDDSSGVEGMKRAFSRGSNSDFLSYWHAFSGWLKKRAEGGKEERQFVRDNFLSMQSLNAIQTTKKQLERYLLESQFISKTSLQQQSQQQKSTGGGGGGGGGYGGRFTTLDGTIYEIGGAPYNTNSSSMKCITAAIVGGLHPNIARVTPKNSSSPAGGGPPRGNPNSVPCSTVDGSSANVHPSSVNGKSMGQLPFPFVAYVEKIKTSTIFLRETTVVSPYTLILFAGDSRYFPEYEELAYDSCFSFRCSAADAALLLGLRRSLDSALTAKINSPEIEYEAVADRAVRAMVKLIHEESSTSLLLTTQRPRYSDDAASKSTLAQPSAQAAKRAHAAAVAAGSADPDKPKMSYAAQMRLAAKRCFACGEFGHVSSMCKNPPARWPGGPADPCFCCGSRSHHPIDCEFMLKRELPEGLSATFGDGKNPSEDRGGGGGRGGGGRGRGRRGQ